MESPSRHPLSLSLSLYHDHLSSLSILLHPLYSLLHYSLLSTLLSCLLPAVDASVSIPPLPLLYYYLYYYYYYHHSTPPPFPCLLTYPPQADTYLSKPAYTHTYTLPLAIVNPCCCVEGV